MSADIVERLEHWASQIESWSDVPAAATAIREAAAEITRLRSQVTPQTMEAAPRPDPAEQLCSDCPPIGYPTAKTRCLKCPRIATAHVSP